MAMTDSSLAVKQRKVRKYPSQLPRVQSDIFSHQYKTQRYLIYRDNIQNKRA